MKILSTYETCNIAGGIDETTIDKACAVVAVTSLFFPIMAPMVFCAGWGIGRIFF